MSFVKKTFLYALLFFTLFLKAGYAQEFIKPTLLLKNTEGYQFYSFENNTLSLYNITPSSEYLKIWEYQILKNKEAELVSILFGDIKGGQEKEIIVVIHSFGSQGELYIFSIQNNKPTGSPEILQIPTAKPGTRPTQAQLINWDQQKKQEILLSCSSPERELFVLDYYNNKLSVITSLATDFMTSTYGPVKLFITDQNKDGIDDVLIYSKKNQTEQYTVLSKEDNQTKTLIENINFSSIKHIQNKKETLGLLNNSNEIYSITNEKKIKTTTKTVSIVGAPNTDLITLTDQNQLMFIPNLTSKPYKNKFIDLAIPTPNTHYIVDKNNTAGLFFNDTEEIIILVLFSPALKQQALNPSTNTALKKTQAPLSLQATKTILHDTLYINAGTEIIIPILKPDSLNIESIETHKKPETMILDPKTLEFIWVPKATNTGPKKFEYSVSYISEPKLQQTQKTNTQLALKNTFITTNEKHQYIIYVNDIPALRIDSPVDTIHSTGFFESAYNIIDTYHIEPPKIKILEGRQNNVLINNTTLYWEPGRLDTGEQKFLIIADDGMAQDTALISVFVDTAIKKIEYDTDLITTVNESFIHRLPYTKDITYNILQSPNNLRVSPKGELYWIPIITQVDLNTIIIEAKTAQKTTEHILNVYVNAPPVISSQPAPKEKVTKGEKFQFQFQSFDMNTDAELQWTNISNSDTTLFTINQFGMLEFDATNQIDNFSYVIHLNDKIDKDIFIGELYVNDPPKILSTPTTHISFGETYEYILLIEDNNMEKPYHSNETNQIYYTMPKAPQGASFNNTNQTVSWQPTKEQIGKNSFIIEATDSIDIVSQEFSVFVNARPNIVSPDSLSIMLGDTLFHYFNAQDLNQDSELLYTIKTTIDEILFSGKAGKLEWVPKEEDLGFHTLEISVSDGFNTGTDIQKLNIFVYKKPTLLNGPKEEAFVNMEYKFIPKGYDMFKDSIPNKDVFFNISSQDSLFKGGFDPEKNIFRWTPTIEEIGEKTLLITVFDKYKHQYAQSYPVNVILSPCETLKAPCEGLDTLIINQTDTIEKTILDSVFIEKKDTIYIDKKNVKNPNNRNNWKPKGLGF